MSDATDDTPDNPFGPTSYIERLTSKAFEMKTAALGSLLESLGGPEALGGPVAMRVAPLRTAWPVGVIDLEQLVDATHRVLGEVEVRFTDGEIIVEQRMFDIDGD